MHTLVGPWLSLVDQRKQIVISTTGQLQWLIEPGITKLQGHCDRPVLKTTGINEFILTWNIFKLSF